MQTTEELAPEVGVAPICDAIGISRASLYRRRRPRKEPRRATPARALSEQERKEVLQVLQSKRSWMQRRPRSTRPSSKKIATCARPRTMYRLLTSSGEVRERRDQVQHPRYVKPELVATAPQQVWSWDITKLKGPVKLVYLYLYVILDIFSRYVVGWMIAEAENAGLAERLIEQTCLKQGIAPDQLTLHAHRGSPVISKTVAQLLAELGIDKSHGRPRVSNDTPFSEALFKTAKYRPAMPGRFAGASHACEVFREVFGWYNHHHHHSGIAYLTPAVVHYGRADEILGRRHRARKAAYLAHPDRFVNGPPRPENLPPAVWINPPEKTTHQDAPDMKRLATPSVVASSAPQARSGLWKSSASKKGQPSADASPSPIVVFPGLSGPRDAH